MKAAIFDLDRTLLRSDKSVSKYTLDVLKRCRRKGVRLMAATARPERSIAGYQEMIGFDAAVTMNGARVLLPDRVMENAIRHESARLILQRLMRFGSAVISIETDEGIFANVPIPEWNAAVFNSFPNLPVEGAVYKLLASSADAALYEQIAGLLTEDTYHSLANGSLIQVMSINATKWNGVKAMLLHFGLAADDAVYFGDDHDDLECLQNCGTGVAVANAIPPVLEAADVVAVSNDEDGVARYLERYL